MIYNKIYDFCKVRNNGNCFRNGPEPTPRVKFIMDLLDSEGIKYELDTFTVERPVYDFPKIRRPIIDFYNKFNRDKKNKNKNKNRYYDFWDDLDDLDIDDVEEEIEEEKVVNNYFNIIMKGSSNRMVIAHHDVNNCTTDNANDNSASVINVIATKKLRPEINAVIVDGEEFGGIGSSHLGKQIKEGKFGSIEWVLNYELTGKGGKYFFIGSYPGKLTDKIVSLFNCPIVRTPFNDSVTIRQYGIDSTVINPLPPLPEGEKSDIEYLGKYLQHDMLYHCHSPKDSVSTISPKDMEIFVEEVVLKIIDSQ